MLLLEEYAKDFQQPVDAEMDVDKAD